MKKSVSYDATETWSITWMDNTSKLVYMTSSNTRGQPVILKDGDHLSYKFAP